MAIALSYVKNIYEGTTLELKNNKRTLLGFISIIFIVLIYGWTELDRFSEQQLLKNKQKTEEISKLENLLQQNEWPEHYRQLTQIYQQLENRLWQSETTGLAQATLQDFIANLASQAGINQSQVQVQQDDTQKPYPQITAFTIKLSGGATQIQAQNFFSLLYRAPSLFVVRRAAIQTTPFIRFDVDLIAFVKIQTLEKTS
jgi:hypothetical protein